MSSLHHPANQLTIEQKRKLLAQHLRQKVMGMRTFPLSFAQQRLWFLEQWEPHSPLYNLFACMHLEGPLVMKALDDSLQYLAHRHASLRTTFAVADEQPVQVVHPTVTIPLSVIDLTQLAPEEHKQVVQSLLIQEEQRPFDLEQGPLLRCTLLRLGPTDHTFVLTMHHSISDAWSMSVFYHELSVAYNCILAQQPPSLPALPIQYADFALWQRQYLQGSVLDEQLRYWRTQLSGAPALLNLPTDYPRPAQQSFRGLWMPFEFSEHFSTQIKELGQQNGVTLFMTLYAALNILLARYSGQDDIVIGSPIANRTRTELEGLIGFFVNTLALRTSITNTLTVREFLLAIRDTTLGAYAHQELPFEKLVEELSPERSTGHSPLFQTLLILQNAPMASRQMKDLRMWGEEPESQHVMFDLTFTVLEQHGRLSGMIGYRTDLFQGATIQRLIGHFHTLLEQMVADPGQPIAQLSLLTRAQQQQLLTMGRGTPALSPSHLLVHQLFEAQVRQTPEGEALTFQEKHFTYTQVNTLSNQLAHLLLAHNAIPTRPILVMLSRGALPIISLLAILKAGCPFVCLDRQAPELRLGRVLHEVEPTCIITEPSCLRERPELLPLFQECVGERERIVEVSLVPVYHGKTKTQWQLIAHGEHTLTAFPATNPDVELHPESPAYIAYTSGSTGVPRGIVQSHRNFSHFINWFQSYFQLHAPKRVAQWPTLTFDPALAEIFSTLCFGATLCVATDAVTSDPLAVVRWLRKEQVAFLQTVPSFFRYMLQAGEQELESSDLHALFPSLESLLLTGEVLPLDLAETLLHNDAGRWTLYNLYGPTETILATCHAVHAPVAHMATIPVGRPIAGCQVLILDDTGHLCPIGVTGEISIGGTYVSDGYYRRPEETAQRFLPCPVQDLPVQERCYRTGDMGRWRSDGTLEFIGRRDLQVKIRGMRIELEEVEAALLTHPLVERCAVTTHRDQQNELRLVAYIVPQPPLTIPHTQLLAEIKRSLKRSIPDYMQPTVFVLRDQLPVTSSGKTDRGALPPPVWEQLEQTENQIAPRDPVEDLLLTIWTDVLRRQHIGIHDHFFEIGGHSLLATQVAARIRDIFQVEVSVRNIFELTTIAELARYLNQARRTDSAQAQPPLTRRSEATQQRFPLSFAQQRLWFLSQIAADQTLYMLPMSIRLQGPLHVDALEQSINELIRRHESLRTSFLLEHGEPLQLISPGGHLDLACIDLSSLPRSQRDEAAGRLLQEGERAPIDLSQSPLMHAWLVRLDMETHFLVMSMHHIVSDGWSLNIFRRELSLLYDAYAQQRPASLPERPIHYADFTLWQRSWLHGAALGEHVAYWRQQLAGAPALLDLPTDYPRPTVQTYHGSEYTFSLPGELVERVQKLSRHAGATLFMTLLTAFAVLLARYSGQDDLVVGTPIANRTHMELEQLIGFFVNTLALRINLSEHPTFRAALAQVREMTLEAYAHQTIPFEKLVEELSPERHLAHSPLFQVLFSLQNTTRAPLTFSDLIAEELTKPSTTAQFDLTLMMAETQDGMIATFEYNTDLFRPERIERMADHFHTLLQHIVEAPDRSVAHLPLLSAEERQRILVTWNQTDVHVPTQRCLHDLFDEQAQRTPHALAVSDEQKSLTYAALQQRSTQLAHYLVSLDLQPEQPVGILLDRTVGLLVALLGVLKAGGTYLPLDPAYPQERLAYMLRDAGVSLVVTEQALHQDVPFQPIQKVLLDTDWPTIEHVSPARPLPNVSSEQLAYILYTSGSTGYPKGVQVSHRNVVTFLSTIAVAPGIQADDRLLALTTLSFDIAALELFLPLMVGAQVLLAGRATALDGQLLAEAILTRGATIMQATPASWRLLLDAGWRGDALLNILCGGEALPQELARQLLTRGRTVWNLYGPTETTIWSSRYQLHAPLAETGTVPIGRPIGNTRMFILDGSLEPVPIGIVGDLYIGGEGVTRGYLHQPDLTAERFVPDPWSTHPGARMYATGDQARFTADGTIEFLGRGDQQVKVRGHRIELGEIETILEHHPAVRQAVVLVREDEAGYPQLVAYLVRNDNASCTLAELRAYIRDRLPEYMLPSHLIWLPELPLTANRKVDRRRLPKPESLSPASTANYVAPRSQIEQTIAAIWQEVLHVDKVGIHDAFFDLGGHSLLLTRVVRMMNDALHSTITILDIFQHPTIDALASFLHQEQPQQPALQRGQQRADMRRTLRQQRFSRDQTQTTRQEQP